MRILLTLLAVAVVLIGCRRNGGGEDEPRPTPTHSVTATAAATTTPMPDPTSAATDVPSATLGSIPTANHGEATGSLTFDDRDRTWRIYVPSSLPSGQRVPLVIGLHGGLGTGEQFARNTRFDQQAEDGAFIAVYPDGVVRTWNAGRCCGTAARTDVDDVGFIEALIEHLAATYPIDTSRVYATGHSNGAMMALRLVCELPERIVAVGAVAGGLEVSSCTPSEPRSVLLIHGDADQNHPLNGGQGPNSIAGVDFISVADSMETIRRGMSCAAVITSASSGGITTDTWTGCPPGIEVQLMVIEGASHAWPSGTGGIADEPGQLLAATQTVWQFVSQH